MGAWEILVHPALSEELCELGFHTIESDPACQTLPVYKKGTLPGGKVP